MTYKKPIFSKGTTNYKDIDLSFKFNPTTGDLRISTDDNAIKQSLKNIVFTLYGDRPFDPDFGGGLHHLLFEQLDEITKIEIKNRLTETISYHEPRVSIQDIKVNSDTDDNEVSISISYTIRNQATPQSLNIILNRVR